MIHTQQAKRERKPTLCQTEDLESTAASISQKTLMNAVIELEEAYNHYKDDPEFNREHRTFK